MSVVAIMVISSVGPISSKNKIPKWLLMVYIPRLNGTYSAKSLHVSAHPTLAYSLPIHGSNPIFYHNCHHLLSAVIFVITILIEQLMAVVM